MLSSWNRIRSLQCIKHYQMFSTKAADKRTCLYDFHVERKGRMVEFAGYQMPVLYEGQSITSSHNHTRKHVSIFDVSHMLQSTLKGKDCIRFLEHLTVTDIQGLKENSSTLSLFTNDKGGIKDDLIITKTESGDLFLVSNAGCTEKDIAHIQNNIKTFEKGKADVQFDIVENRSLIAVQGPETAKVLEDVVDCDLKELKFMTSKVTTICGIKDCRISRCGYTGEDGVEMSLPNEKARYIIEQMLSSNKGEVKLAGLAVRDSLRLEAGLCLYGNDITESITPIEAGLTWTIGKRRRQEGSFPGANVILQQLKDKPAIKRIGLVSVGPPPRAHTKLLDETGKVIGEVTSGLPSPYLDKNIAMGYLPMNLSTTNTKVRCEIRKKIFVATVVKMPFVPTRYYISEK